MKNIKVIIVDDEQLAREIIKEYLLQHTEFVIVAECTNGFEAVKAIMHYQPDLIFLDIQMPKINGFEMLELLDELPGIIFTTAYDEYAIKAFEKNAVDYLLKPFSQERFDTALRKWTMPKQEGRNFEAVSEQMAEKEHAHRIVTRIGSEIRIIAVSSIHYLEAQDDYVKIFSDELTFLKKKTLSFYESSLDKRRFLRVHRSYLINLQQLSGIEPYEKNTYLAILKNGKKIPVSRSGYARLKEVLGW